MKLKSLLGMLAGLGVAVGGALVLPTTSQAESYNNNTYFCAQLNGSWNTFVNTPRGRISLINWVNQFSEEWTPQKRCSAVSQRFQTFLDTGNLKYIRTGEVNNYPVICVANARGGNCPNTNVLITLQQGVDAERVLVSLVDFRRSVSGNTITLSSDDAGFYSGGEFYVDVEKFLNRLPVDK